MQEMYSFMGQDFFCCQIFQIRNLRCATGVCALLSAPLGSARAWANYCNKLEDFETVEDDGRWRHLCRGLAINCFKMHRSQLVRPFQDLIAQVNSPSHQQQRYLVNTEDMLRIHLAAAAPQDCSGLPATGHPMTIQPNYGDVLPVISQKLQKLSKIYIQ